jgi:hypothetical protein
MNAEVFEEIGYYFKQSLNLIVYAYKQIEKDKSEHPYSRLFIHKTISRVRQTNKSQNEIEDYLRNDMVNKYLKRLKKLFNLEYFSIQAGVEESKQNVKIGIVDIKFEYTSATSMDGTAFIFECKRLNKYAESQNAYIKDGMMRFISGQYYPESGMSIAGMIAFVEVDLEKKPNGYLPIDQVADLLKKKIDTQKRTLKIVLTFSLFKLTHKKYHEISNFKYSYLSKHIRDDDEDNRNISIHHLLLDYYDILVS